jgi:hypothetical protein
MESTAMTRDPEQAPDFAEFLGGDGGGQSGSRSATAGIHIEALYAAAARAGMLKHCTRKLADGALQAADVGFARPDETLLDGLTVAPDVVITFAASSLPGLKAGELLNIEGQHFQVRDLRVLGDGSEVRAQITRL